MVSFTVTWAPGLKVPELPYRGILKGQTSAYDGVVFGEVIDVFSSHNTCFEKDFRFRAKRQILTQRVVVTTNHPYAISVVNRDGRVIRKYVVHRPTSNLPVDFEECKINWPSKIPIPTSEEFYAVFGTIRGSDGPIQVVLATWSEEEEEEEEEDGLEMVDEESVSSVNLTESEEEAEVEGKEDIMRASIEL